MPLKNNNQKIAAVLILEELKSNSFILTRRSKTLRMQPGEVCFPGGIMEEDDLSILHTALREVSEELGIEEARIDVIKELKKDKTISGITISPHLARIENIEPYQINPHEVIELIKLPAEEVLNQKNYQRIKISKYGLQFETDIYNASEHFIWGVTARIMKHLASMHHS